MIKIRNTFIWNSLLCWSCYVLLSNCQSQSCLWPHFSCLSLQQLPSIYEYAHNGIAPFFDLPLVNFSAVEHLNACACAFEPLHVYVLSTSMLRIQSIVGWPPLPPASSSPPCHLTSQTFPPTNELVCALSWTAEGRARASIREEWNKY